MHIWQLKEPWTLVYISSFYSLALLQWQNLGKISWLPPLSKSWIRYGYWIEFDSILVMWCRRENGSYLSDLLFVTTCIRRMGEGIVFSLSVHTWGVPHLANRWGYPHSANGGYPIQPTGGGNPILPDGGTTGYPSPIRTRWSTPWLGLDGGTSLSDHEGHGHKATVHKAMYATPPGTPHDTPHQDWMG